MVAPETPEPVPWKMANPSTSAALKALDLDQANVDVDRMSAEEIVRWADATFGDGLVVSTSFGIQSAVILHLAACVRPDIAVVWVDTGYLPPETYHYAETLTDKLQLNLKVYQASMSPARMEAIHGRLWEQDDVEALNLYDRIRKVEPMQRALVELGAKAWIAGLRSDQTEHRSTLKPVGVQWERHKILPILKWTSKDVYQYMMRHELPFHPLYEKGYTTVGDWHSSRPAGADDEHERDSRFRGLKQECGLHLPEYEI